MKAWIALAALPLLGCTPNSIAPLQTKTPVMLGPIDRIGGKPTPVDEDEIAKADKFEGEGEVHTMYCFPFYLPGGIDLTGTSDKSTAPAVVDSMHAQTAKYAGTKPIRAVTARATRIGAGAWAIVFPLCYMNDTYTLSRGKVEAPK